jgi:hypothetical protein
MADINISKYTTQVLRVGSTPSSPGFAVDEGQDPVDPSGNPQSHLPVTIGSPANGLAVTDAQILTINKAQIFAGTASQFVKGDGTLDSTAYGTGSVTSVALTMPTAFSVAGSPVTTAGTLAVTATGTTAQYIRGDGSLETFPSLTGFVPYTGATADVNLGTHDLTAERGTFQNNGSSDTLTVNHTSGSGYGIKVTKGGNNEALYVSKTSGSGNAMTVIGGRTSLVDLALSTVTNTAGDFLTLSGGVVHKRTAAEVRTDIGAGTVTSVAALTLGTIGTDLSSSVANGTTTPVITLNVPTASASNRGALSAADWTTFNSKQQALNGTGFVKASGTTISYDNTSYLPLTGGTLTGPLNGTSATFSDNLTVTNSARPYFIASTTNSLEEAGIQIKQSTVSDWYIGTAQGTLSPQDLAIRDVKNSRIPLAISIANGAAIFISSVTASSFIKTGGTSAQFLKADGSVDSTTYVPTSRTITINGTSQDLSSDRTYNVGTVTSVTATAGTGISISGSPITSSGTLTITNTAPDQVVSLTASTGISISGTYPNFTITNTSPSSGGTVTGTGASGQVAYWSSSPAITGESNLFWDATNDRLGIKTNNPAVLLTLGNIGAANQLGFYDGATAKGFIGIAAGTSDIISTDALNDMVIRPSAAGNLLFAIGGTERMRLTSGGQLGIGTTTIDSAISVDIQNLSASSNNVLLRLKNNSASEDCGFIVAGIQGGNAYEHTFGVLTLINSGDFIFHNSNTKGYRWYIDGNPAIMIASNGNVLIGTTTDVGYKLDVNGQGRFTGLTATTVNASTFTASQSYETTGNGAAIKITSNIGTFGGYFQTMHHMVLETLGEDRNVYVLDSNGIGVVKLSGAQSWSAQSDGRIKTVHSFLENNLSKLKNINPIYYSFNNYDDNNNRIGLIAQEVQEHFPELVAINPKTDYLSLDYTGLIPVLLGAIKELKQEIDILKN